MQRKTDYCDKKQYRRHKHQQNKQIKTENKNGKKSNCIDITNNKQMKSHLRFVHGQKRETCTWPKKGNLKKETECILRTAQNNTIRTNYVVMVTNLWTVMNFSCCY